MGQFIVFLKCLHVHPGSFLSYLSDVVINGMSWMEIKSYSLFNSDINEGFLLFCTYSKYLNMNKKIWGNGWNQFVSYMHVCSPFLIYFYCTHPVSNDMVRTLICSWSSIYCDLNGVFLLLCKDFEYCNKTKSIWGNGCLHFDYKMYACLSCLLWFYCTRPLSNGLILLLLKSSSPVNYNINKVFFLFFTNNQYYKYYQNKMRELVSSLWSSNRFMFVLLFLIELYSIFFNVMKKTSEIMVSVDFWSKWSPFFLYLIPI